MLLVGWLVGFTIPCLHNNGYIDGCSQHTVFPGGHLIVLTNGQPNLTTRIAVKAWMSSSKTISPA